MTDLFLTIVNMGISAGWLVVAVVLIRLLIKKAPKWITVLLWGVVALRLLCPLSIESVMSLIPSAQTISPDIMLDSTPAIDSGVPIINNAVNPLITDTFTPTPAASANPLQIWIPILAAVWGAGMVAMLGYTAVSYWRLHRRVATAVRLRDNIYQSECVESPFVLGIIRPRIYLPFGIGVGDMAYVISHERAHLRRRDHWWKPFGFLLLTVYWFHPLMWVGYVLLCRDIELACDERVVKELDTLQRADYSQALLTCSVNRRSIAACPLAFGEVGVKDRVKSVLSYKKPAFWLVIAAVVALIAVAVCFLTNPVATDTHDRLLGVLNNEEPFVDVTGSEVYFKDYLCDGSARIPTDPQKYAFVDFDGDGADELVVRATSNNYTHLVFRIHRDKVYGTEIAYEWKSFKQDGTFRSADGIYYLDMQFDEGIGGVVQAAIKWDAVESYRIGGEEVTSQQAAEYAAAYEKKPDAVWTDYRTGIDAAVIAQYRAFLNGSETATDAAGNVLTVDEFMYDEKLGDDYTYAYYDMTGDGVPELFIEKRVEKYIFTLRDGELHHWYTADAAYTTLLNNGALLYERHGGAPEHINYTYYELDKDGAVRFSIDFSQWDEEVFNGVHHPAYYEFDGKQVSAQTYERKTKKYREIGSDEIVWYDRYGFAQTAETAAVEINNRLRGVLKSNVTFVTMDGTEHLLKDYVATDGNVFVPQMYTCVDFEGDGVEELVVYGNESYGVYMIFHPEGDKMWGFERDVRALINLKQDGTFMRSSGIVGDYARIYFGAHGMLEEELAYADDMEKVYRLHGAPSTQEKVQQYIDEFHQKPDAVWIGRGAASTVATGEYKGKTVTATYTVTDVPYPWDMQAIPTVNGYAHLYDYSKYEEYPNMMGRWNAMDSHGNLLFEVPYRQLSYFSKEGVAVAQKQNGDYVSVTTAGEETPITEQEFERLYRQYYGGQTPPKEYASKTPAGALEGGSNLYRGLALYIEPSTGGTYLVGVADTDGNVIIPAYVRVSYSEMTEHLYLDEGTAYVEDALSGLLGKITVTIS